MSKIDVKFAIEHRHKADTTEPTHKHRCYELVYYVKGNGKSIIGTREYSYAGNTIAFISSDKEHSEYHQTETDVIFFGYTISNDLFKLVDGIYMDEDGVILGLFQEIIREHYLKDMFYKIAIENAVEKILLLLCRKINKPSEKEKIESYIERAIDYININLQNDITSASVAANIGYSYGHFRHQFLKYMGVGVKEYILRARIDAAKEYLVNSNQTIEKIAERFRFSNSSHFSTVFKRYIGMMPNQYRKEYIEENHIEVKYKDQE